MSSSSSSKMMWEIDQEEEELFNQSEATFNGGDWAGNLMEEDDESRMARASHSCRVIQAVAHTSRPNRAINIERSRQRRGHELLNDYFVCNSAFPDTYFRRRFRMERHLFNKIMGAVCNHDSYFVQKADAFGVMGLLPEQKITAALRMFAYGAAADQVDELTRMGKSTILESLMRFCSAIESIYTAEYLRRPTPDDLQRLLKNGEMRGFPGMIGSIDCMHWTWKNCPSAWQGAYGDRKGAKSIMMTCIILHNMIVEDEYDYDAVDEYEPDPMNNSRTQIYCAHDATEEPVQHDPLQRDGRYNDMIIQRYTALQRPYMHNARQLDLIEHQWAHMGVEDA